MKNIPNSLRSEKLEIAYQLAKSNKETTSLHKEIAIADFGNWRLIQNRYPYDLVFSRHDMLIANKGQTMVDSEAQDIIEGLLDYDIWFVNFKHRRSVHDTFHIHLGKYKSRGEIR